MAGTVSFPNMGSNIDVQSIINAYVSAESTTQTQMQQHVQDLQTESTSISDISSALSTLSSALSDLSDSNTIQSYTATSSGSAIATSVVGTPQSGAYSVDVVNTAQAYRAYSNTLSASQTDPANLSGVLHIAVGANSSADVNISDSDSLGTIVGKINSSGLRVTASTFYDGSDYRIQLTGLDTGDANQVTLSGLDLGFSDKGNAIQQAANAHLKVDNIDVYSPTNQITGAIPGVTLAATANTTSPITVTVASDPQGLTTKIQSMVSAYNAVFTKVHTTAGYGTTAASVPSLAGDATLRGLTDALSDALLTPVGSDANYTTLGSLGISLQEDGSLKLDQTKLSQAISTDPSAVTNVLAGPSGGKGVMDILSDLANSYDEAGDGILANQQTSISDQVKDWNDQIQQEQTRIDAYTTMLQAEFTAMNTSISSSTAIGNYLTQLYGSTSSGSTSSGSTSSGSTSSAAKTSG
jgi:flagellar hook-associated protein 2